MLDVLGPKLQESKENRDPTDGTNYAPSWLGTRALRQHFANLYNNHILGKTTVAVEHVAVLASATSALDLLMYALCEVSDVVLTPAPCYGSYRRDVEARAACRLVAVRNSQRGTLPSIENLEAAVQEQDSARVVLISNPQNPTGSVMDATGLQAIISWAKERGLHVIVDEVFALSVFEGTFTSALDLISANDTHVHVVYSASKDLALSGYRVGCVLTRATEVIRVFDTVGVFASPSMPAQNAVEDLLADEDWLARVWIPQLRSRLSSSYASAKGNLARHRIKIAGAEPVAGHFCLLDLCASFTAHDAFEHTPRLPSFLSRDSGLSAAEADAILSRMLYDAGVILTPGAPSMGMDVPGIFRLCHAGHDAATVAEGIRRIKTALDKLADITS